MKTFSVFIAGAKNLQPLRLRLKAMANDLNNGFKRNGMDLAVNMVSYENFGDDQSVYNKFISEEADMILFLLDDRIGAKTEEEYKLTVERQKKNGKPEHCVFLKEFDTKTDEIAHIEDLMSSTSNKYYVCYRNPEDLLSKVASRVAELAMKDLPKKGIVKKSSNHKNGWRWGAVLFAILLLIAAFRFATGSLNSNNIYFEMPGFPSDLEQYGINEKFFEQQLLLTINEEAVNAQNKVNHILNDTITRPDRSLAFPASVKSSRFNPLRNSLRKMFGCHDMKVALHLIESGNAITSDLFVTDWKDKVYNRTAAVSVDNPSSIKSQTSVLIRKNAAYLSLPYNPIVSVMYDYHFLNELLVYQMVSPWKDEVFSSLDRESLLSEYGQSGLPNASLAYLLLGNYYEFQGIENGLLKASLNKAIDYYGKLSDDESLSGFVKDKIEALKEYTESVSQTGERNLVDMLESKGAFQTNDCRQMIIIGDEEKLVIGSEQFYKATLYSYEKSPEGEWVEQFAPFKVNLGVKGLVSPKDKIEGDLKTPTGYYAIPFAFGKVNDLKSNLDFMVVGKDHIWVSDTASSKYNQIVIDTDGAYKSNKVNEKLFRNDELYDYAIVIDYNTDPVVAGKGSAIFMHLERSENHRTAGCISMSKENIVKLIEWLDSAKDPHVYLCKQLF